MTWYYLLRLFFILHASISVEFFRKAIIMDNPLYLTLILMMNFFKGRLLKLQLFIFFRQHLKSVAF
ncbi:MAG TPA: hypothetical protein DCG53_05265 [Syntrophus sp. (in: bacteria)]|nr:hypothetical protein [Syntrophus sp. (in: bacteria)]